MTSSPSPEPSRQPIRPRTRTRPTPPPTPPSYLSGPLRPPAGDTYFPNLMPGDSVHLRQRRRDLARWGQTDDLPGVLKALNRAANDQGIGTELFKLVRRDLRLIHERQMIALDDADYKLACAVFSRGLGWGKYSERVTYEQFENGLRRDGDLVEHGSIDLEWLPAFAGTSIPRRTLERRIPALHGSGVITRFRIAHARGYDFHYLYGTPDILQQLLLRHIEKNGRDQKSLGKSLTPARQAKEDVLLELVDGLVRLDDRSPDMGATVAMMIEAERVQAARSHGQLPPEHLPL